LRSPTMEEAEEVSWGQCKNGALALPSAREDEKLSYRRLRLLGQGSFGKAFLARDLQNNELCVMKQIRVEKMDAKARDTAVREAVALRRVKHPNVVGFRQVFVRTGWLCLVMDFADGGDLCAAVKERAKLDSPFEESAVLECFAQIADAVNFVHSVKMVHRDIKSRNIFLCRTGRALLGDFGLVRLLENTLELARTRVGTPYYLSPEIIQRQPYNCKTDVWSLGVLLYEMTALKRPFAGTLETLPKAILQGTYDPLSESYSEGLRDLVAGMLHLDPAHRTVLGDALSGVLKTPLDRAREALNLEVVIPIPRKPKDVEDVSDPASDSGDDLIDFNTMIRREGGHYSPPPACEDGRGTVPTQKADVVKVANLGAFGTIGAGYNTMVRPIRLRASMVDDGQDWSVKRVKDPDSGDDDISMSSDSWGSRVDIGEGNVAVAEV